MAVPQVGFGQRVRCAAGGRGQARVGSARAVFRFCSHSICHRIHWDRKGVCRPVCEPMSHCSRVPLLQNILSYIRFFRDYSIADFAFMLLSACTVSYASFSSATLRAGVCEELGRQPELMRDLSDSGLNLENCEYWFDRAVFAVLGAIVMFVVIRVSNAQRSAVRTPLTPFSTSSSYTSSSLSQSITISCGATNRVRVSSQTFALGHQRSTQCSEFTFSQRPQPPRSTLMPPTSWCTHQYQSESCQ